MITLSVHFAATTDNFDVLSAKVEKAAGCSCESSGFGLGGRDMEFGFKTKHLAQKAADRIDALGLTDFTADID